ncbi:hypothetical protein LRP88_09101 [Fusarium phalaenopsidis]|nr:FAD-binding-3 domain-containing protein [Fusarium sp. Ph1]
MAPTKDFNIAVVGGGIAGLTLAIALHHRGIPVKLYERASRFEEIGAGVSFTPNAVRAMEFCHPGVHEAFEKVCTRNSWPSKQKVWFDFVDGTKDEGAGFTINSSLGQNGVHRAHYLDELAKLFPEDQAVFGKCLDSITESDGKVTMSFADGTTASADAVIGCDGIKSRVRQLVVGLDHPSAHPTYSYKYAYRGMVPMERAVEAVGEERARNATMHLGKGGHVLTFPVDNGRKLNIVAFHTSPTDWEDYSRTTSVASRQDALKDFAGYGSAVTGLLSLTEEQLKVWAIFDLGDHPAPTFHKGRVCIAGDAAHATSPHHGAGAGFCIEDSAFLAELLSSVDSSRDLPSVFETFDECRRERSQWLVQSSRWIGDCYEWLADGIGSDMAKIESEINERNGIIANFDLEGEVAQAKVDLQKRLDHCYKL